MIPTAVRYALKQKPALPPFDINLNPYRAKRLWPPDFKKLSPKKQFNLERRYRRRSKQAWARPQWKKGVRLAQLGSIFFVLVYGILFADWKQENQPFQGIRSWVFGMTGSIWTRQADRVQRRETSDGDSPVTSDLK